MAQNTERKRQLPLVYSLCQGEGGGLQNRELAVNQKLTPLADEEEGRESAPLLRRWQAL